MQYLYIVASGRMKDDQIDVYPEGLLMILCDPKSLRQTACKITV